MQSRSIDITPTLYDKIVQLKQEKSVEQFLSELIFKYSNERLKEKKFRIVPTEDKEIGSISDKFNLINNDKNLSKFKFNKE